MGAIEDKKKVTGITLVALIITIIVLLILAGTTISVLLGDNGILNKAEEASVKTKFAKIQEELDLYVAAKMVKNFNFDVNTLNAYTTEDSLNYNTKPEEEKGNIKTILSATKYDDLGIFEITNGKLLYTANNKKLAQWAKEVGLLVNLYEIDENGTLLSAETNKTLADGTGGILTIPDTIKGKKVTSIGEGAFGLAEGVTKVILPKGVTEIQKNAFRGNTTLREIELPEGLLTIGEYAFADCTSLESMKVPDTVTDIGTAAFRGCTSLTNIKLSKRMKVIRNSLLGGTGVTEIEIPEGIVEIGGDAFSSCRNLTTIKLSSTVSEISIYSFSNTPNLTMIDTSNNSYYSFTGGVLLNKEGTEIKYITKAAYTDGGTTLTIPYGVEKVAGIGDVKKIRIPSTTKELPAYFSQITDIVEFYNAAGQTVTKTEFFSNKNGQICNSDGTILYTCYLINNTEIKVNEGITTINELAFRQCNKATTLELPDSVTTLKGRTFMHLQRVKEIHLGANVTTIEPVNFSYSYFTNITIAKENPKYMAENGAIYIKDENGNKGEMLVFVDSSATTYTVPEGVERIGDAAFITRSNLKSIELKEGLKSIGKDAFQGTGLTTIKIPSTVTSIGDGAFQSCQSLTTVELPNSITEIKNSTFFNCRLLQTIKIPEGVTTIGNMAFYSCTSLEMLQIPSTVETIGGNTFLNCNKLRTVEINRKKDAISGSPWGLSIGNAGIKWTGNK